MPLIEFSLRSLAVLTSLFWIFCSFSTSMAFRLVLASIMTDPSLLRMQSKSSLSFLFKSSHISKLSKSPVPFKTNNLVHESLLIPNRSSKVGWSCVFELLFCFPFLFRFLGVLGQEQIHYPVPPGHWGRAVKGPISCSRHGRHHIQMSEVGKRSRGVLFHFVLLP